jgi:phosphatidylglycerol:prolipoprotein diacylglycerol transferase
MIICAHFRKDDDLKDDDMHPVVFNIGSFTIHSYGVMMALAFLACVGVSVRLGRREGRSPSEVSDLLCWTMLCGIVGARVAHVLAFFSLYAADPVSVLYIHEGGLVFYGGFIGAALGIVGFAWRRREEPLKLLDLVAVGLPLAHAFGRLGCFLNGCCFGKIHHGALSVRFPFTSQAGQFHYGHDHIANEHVRVLVYNYWYQGGTGQSFKDGMSDLLAQGLITQSDFATLPLYPVQLYEAAINILVFVLLYRFFNRRKRAGTVATLYLLVYSVARFGMEFLRGDDRMPVGPITMAQAVSIGLFIGGIVSWVWLHGRKDRADSLA